MGIFKAYDIRGIYPSELDEPLATRIGMALAKFLGNGPIAVGRDMRTSAPAIMRAFTDGVTAMGVDIVDIGMVTTPMSYFAVGHYGLPGGVMVTASHNPSKYIGFKVSREKAIPIGYDTGLGEIERLVASDELKPAPQKGTITKRDIFADHRAHVLRFYDKPARARKLRMVLDAGNGMAGVVYPAILDQLGIDYTGLYMEPDGTFPHHEANPLKPENLRDLQSKVKELGADFGVAIDGDADRCLLIDENSRPVSPDLTTGLIARIILAKEPGGVIVVDARTSRAATEEITKAGGKVLRERVGHSFIRATLRRENAPFGGELSGHFYFRDNFCSDSAIIALVKVIGMLQRDNRTLSQIVEPLRRYANTGEINFHIEDKAAKLKQLAEKFSDAEISHLDGITVNYPDWWFNVRPSNTEPLLRLVLEANTGEIKERGLTRVLEVLGKAE